MPEVVVQLQALDGTWETCGVDRANGITPENLRPDADLWGSKGLVFDLRRDPSAVWPDVSAFTPVKVIIDGDLIWSGRVSETPSRDGAEQVMSVACEGWQHHLDDDMYERSYAHNRMTDWVDTRSLAGAPLANMRVGATVIQQDGSILMGWPTGFTTVAALDMVSVTLDLGTSVVGSIEGAVTILESTFGAGTFTLYIKGHANIPTMVGTGTNHASVDAATLGRIYGTSSPTTYRYISLVLYKNAGGSVTETVDRVIRVSDPLIVTDAAWSTTGTTRLLASQVVTDAVTRAGALLSTDRTGITATSFYIPHYSPGEPRTPREHWAAVNAYHGWQSKIDVDKRAIFQALPTRPKYEVGDWSAVEIQDSSQNSGQDIYNKVIVTGTDPAGRPVRVTRYSSQQIDGFTAMPDLYWPNPSFDTNTAGWTPDVGSITRTTTAGEFDSSPAAGKISSSGGIGAASTVATGSVKPGVTYELTLRARASSALACAFAFGTAGAISYRNDYALTTSFQTFTFYVTAVAGDTGLNFSVSFGTLSGQTVMIDSLTLRVARKTLADRRGLTRTKQLAVSSTLPSDGVAAAQIGDTWLAGHTTTPFRGSITLTGPNALRNRLSGQPVKLAELLRNTGEMIYFGDRPDPDTGAAGRSGRIAAVSYDPASDVASVTLDNTRSDLDTLLSRLAVVQGGGS